MMGKYRMERKRRRGSLLLGGILLILVVGGCGRLTVHPDIKPTAPSVPFAGMKTLSRLAYSIQAGAFTRVENAAHLTRSLQQKGLDATYFVAYQGLYKVRFGNFPSREQARERAEDLRAGGIIEEFYIVAPEEYTAAQWDGRGEAYLREELVRTARSFIGVPYLWGGSSVETGFDCSGLTMTVYHLNGLDLPRTSRDQFTAGIPVDPSAPGRGDILFFADGGAEISHVGIYAGDGWFIHAPGWGKRIRADSLAVDPFKRTFAGARSYL